MFERFTADARSVVVGAQDEARALRNPAIGTDHLVLSMLTGHSVGAELLTARGMSADSVRRQIQEPDGRLDSDALATLGIDLGKVRRAAEEQFGAGALERRATRVPQGHIPFSKPAKKVLELAVREAGGLGSASINSAHLLLGVIREGGAGARLIRNNGTDLDELMADARLKAEQQAA